MGEFTQSNRHIAIESPLGEDKLLLRRISGHEEASTLYAYTLDMLSEESDLDYKKIVGEPVTVRIDLPNDEKRFIHGIVKTFSQTVPFGALYEYRAELVPAPWVLTQTTDSRVWQNKKVPEIITEVLGDHGFTDVEDRLEASNYQPWVYCVQYQETDFNFISRLMELEGIYYYWKHEEHKHTLVLCDSLSKHDDCPDYEEVPFRSGETSRAAHMEAEGFWQEQVVDWNTEHTIRSGKFAHGDYNFTTPKNKLVSGAEMKGDHSKADADVFEYPGEFPDKAGGDRYAKVRMEELACLHCIHNGTAAARGLRAGYTFSLGDFWREEQNAKYLIIATQLIARVDDYDNVTREEQEPRFMCKFQAIPATVQFRAARRAVKPSIHSVQTAVVVGPSGEEIETDEYGRVKVQFHWDRYGQNNENSSCWVRVSQGWAGKAWGMMAIPRIGQEVVVAFLEGDPDQPMIVGRVYNADQTVPYALPANKTQTGILTRITKEGATANFNELRFEDKKDSEEIYFHAEKDFNRVVENNDTLKVGFDKMDPGDQTIEVYNNRTVTIDQGNETFTVKTGDRIVNVDTGADTHNVKTGDRTVNVDSGNQTTTVKSGNITMKASAGECTIEAAQKITLKVGGSTITIEPAKISIASAQIEVSGEGKVDVSSPLTSVDGSGTLKLSGGMIKIN